LFFKFTLTLSLSLFLFLSLCGSTLQIVRLVAYSPVESIIPLGYDQIPIDSMQSLEFCSCFGVDGGGCSSYGPMNAMVVGIDTCDL
jgi:hypothetical protein